MITGRKTYVTFGLMWWIALGMTLFQVRAAEPAAKLELSSSAFAEGAAIPALYTCEGKNISPPLKWSGVPAGAKSLVLIADDPDAPAGTWVHWVLYGLPPGTTELPEHISHGAEALQTARQGRNDAKHLGYDGPCPPSGKHRYFFKLYALDRMLDLKPGATKKEVEAAMTNHILAKGQLMGTYQRSRH